MAIKKFKVMASNANKEAKSDGSCIPKSMRKDVKSGCTKKSVKASDTAKKFRVDIYKRDNPDALVKREVKTFNSEDEAKKYGESIANGGIVNVIEVKASRTKKSVKSSIKATTELNDFYNVIYDMDGTWENPTTGWVGKCEIYQRDLDDGSYLFSLVFGDNESEPDEILFVPSEDKFTIYPNSGMPRFANSLSEFKRELKQEYSYLRKVSDSVTSAEKSVKSSKSLTVPKSKRKSVKATVSSDYDADTRFGLAGDVLYRAGVANKPHGAALAYYMPNNYVLTFNHGHGEMQSADLIFTLWNPNAKDEFDYAGILYTDLDSASAGNDETEVYVSDKTVLPLGETKKFKNFRKALDWLMKQANKKSVESSKSVKKFGIKASALAKRKAQQRITASDYRDDDIVMYFNGDNVYTGSIYDLADAVENLCYDDEVNAKFQEWCNQFGDPFDFDGSPIDTARVFTDIIIHEADEAPETENGGSQFYEDGNGILDFEIFYANDGIYSDKSIKCAQGSYSDFDEDMPFYVAQYYDTKFRDTAESASFDDMDEAVDYAHECLGKGPTSIEHYSVGRVDIDPDEYWENFDGEFWCTPELAEWRDEVWKSMGIGASKSIKCNDGIAPDDYDSIEDLVPEAYALSGGEDDDMLEYVDDYIATEGCPATVNFVTYNTPNDWSVDVSKYGEAVVSDFIWYLEEVASELSDKFYDYPSYEDDTTRNAFKGTKYEEGGKYATFYGDDALAANDYEFQFYPAQNQWSAPQIEFDTDELKLIGFTDDEIDKLMQIYEDYKTAWVENCKYINAHIGEFLADLESNVNASTNIKAGITVGEDSRFDFSNPIYELDDYVKAIADGVVNQIQGITYDISKETIAFFDDDNNVVFVQPIGGIIPEPDDLETDIDELSAAIKSEMDNAYARDNWESDEDDSDYASRAVELSEDIGEVDIDDLEPITGDGDDENIDYGFGFDSNGDAIDESTVEELYRIAEYEILPKSELAKIDEYVSIDEDSWDFYMSSPHVTEKFYIHFELTEKDIDFNKYALPEATAFPDFNYYTAVLDFDIYTENGEVTSVVLEEVKIYRPDGAFDDYDVRRFDKLYNVDAIINYVEALAADTVMDIYNGTTNL